MCMCVHVCVLVPIQMTVPILTCIHPKRDVFGLKASRIGNIVRLKTKGHAHSQPNCCALFIRCSLTHFASYHQFTVPNICIPTNINQCVQFNVVSSLLLFVLTCVCVLSCIIFNSTPSSFQCSVQFPIQKIPNLVRTNLWLCSQSISFA